MKFGTDVDDDEQWLSKYFKRYKSFSLSSYSTNFIVINNTRSLATIWAAYGTLIQYCNYLKALARGVCAL